MIRRIRVIAVLAIGLVGLVHLELTCAAYAKAPYEGLLFLASGLGGILAAVGISWRASWGWRLGAAVAMGTLAGFLVSRTVGLPGLPPARTWFSPESAASVIAELLFLLAFVILRVKHSWRAAAVPSVHV